MRPITCVVLVLTAAACNDSTGPLADLSELGSSLDVVNTVFASPLAQSLGVFRFAGPLPAPAPGAPLIADSMLGKTFAYSCASQHYGVTADPGAPATGVRIVLYRRATDGSIACPATSIGQLDLFDASSAGTNALHGEATGLDGGAPLVAYTITHNVADAQGEASATGFVSDGHGRLDFQVIGVPGSPNHRIVTVQLDDSAADLHAVLQHEAQMGVDTYSDDRDLTVHGAALSAELKGSVGWFNTFRSWDEIISFDDVPVAKVNDGPTITPVGGLPPFTVGQRQVLLSFVSAPDSIIAGVGGVLGAGAHLVRLGI